MENESKYPVLRYHVDAKLDGDALIYQPSVCDDMAKTFLAFREASEYAALASWGFRREDVVRALEEADRLRAENAELRERLAAADTDVGGKDNNVPTKEQNEPLTMEQLREMDGEPVYDYLGQEWYVIQEYYDHELTMTDGTRFFDDDEIDGVDKRFYRRPPEGEA